MKPIFQTTIDDCFQAAIASILELRLDEIPAYNEEESKDFYDEKGNPISQPANDGFNLYLSRLNDTFLFERNLSLITIVYREDYCPKGYAILAATVTSEGTNKDMKHALVTLDGAVIHDPSQKQQEYVTDNFYFVFQSLNPALSERLNDEKTN